MARPKTTKPAQLPAFRSDAEERKFWETHGPPEYLTHMRPIRVDVSQDFLARVKARKRRVRLSRYVAMQKAWHAEFDLRGQSKSAGEMSPPIS